MMDINQIKKLGRKVNYTGRKKLDDEKFIKMLEKKAYTRKELMQIFNVSNGCIYRWLKRLEEKGILRKALYNRQVYYWVEVNKK